MRGVSLSAVRSRGRSRGALLALAVLLVASVLTFAAAQAHYTVQVVALSDRDAALNTVSDLLRQGYPAYVVRSTSDQGDVFRVRVGAFANRPAALLYSEAMPQVGGGQPVPALAEAIPAGLTPLAPRLMLSADLSSLDARLLLLGDTLALRTQQLEPLAPAEYALFRGDTVERVRAWQLAKEPRGGRTLVRNMPLWPEGWRSESEEVLQGYESALTLLVAERLNVEPSVVRGARFEEPGEAPHLVVVERLTPGSAEPELLGIGLPAAGMSAAGPLDYVAVDESNLPGLEEGVELNLEEGRASGRLISSPDGVPEEGEAADVFEGSGWTAVADGPFVRLSVTSEEATEVERPASSWRAAFGAPLFSSGDYLIAHLDEVLLVYDFLPRP